MLMILKLKKNNCMIHSFFKVNLVIAKILVANAILHHV